MYKLGWRLRYNLERSSAKVSPHLKGEAQSYGVSPLYINYLKSSGHNVQDFLDAVGQGFDPEQLVDLVSKLPTSTTNAYSEQGQPYTINFKDYAHLRQYYNLTHWQIERLVAKDPNNPDAGHGALLENVTKLLESKEQNGSLTENGKFDKYEISDSLSKYRDWLRRLGNFGVVQSQQEGYFWGLRNGYSHKNMVEILNRSGKNGNLEIGRAHV